VTRIPETTEVSAPTKPKTWGQGAQPVKPPLRDLIAAEAQHVYVEGSSGEVFAPKRLRAACSDQLGLFGGCSGAGGDKKGDTCASNRDNQAVCLVTSFMTQSAQMPQSRI